MFNLLTFLIGCYHHVSRCTTILHHVFWSVGVFLLVRWFICAQFEYCNSRLFIEINKIMLFIYWSHQILLDYYNFSTTIHSILNKFNWHMYSWLYLSPPLNFDCFFQGHELALHVLYHLHSLNILDSVESSSFVVYEKFLLVVVCHFPFTHIF